MQKWLIDKHSPHRRMDLDYCCAVIFTIGHEYPSPMQALAQKS